MNTFWEKPGQPGHIKSVGSYHLASNIKMRLKNRLISPDLRRPQRKIWAPSVLYGGRIKTVDPQMQQNSFAVPPKLQNIHSLEDSLIQIYSNWFTFVDIYRFILFSYYENFVKSAPWRHDNTEAWTPWCPLLPSSYAKSLWFQGWQWWDVMSID